MVPQIVITVVIIIIFYNIITQIYNNTELLQPSDHEELHCIKL